MSKLISENQMITVKEVATLLGVSSRTVRRMIDSGRIIRPTRVGKNLRWKQADIANWIESGCQAGN